MIKFITFKKSSSPIPLLKEYVYQLAVLYSYLKGSDYDADKRDLLNLRFAELKYNINKQLENLKC